MEEIKKMIQNLNNKKMTPKDRLNQITDLLKKDWIKIYLRKLYNTTHLILVVMIPLINRILKNQIWLKFKKK